VVAGRERNDVLLFGPPALDPVLACELERRFDSLGAAREEVDVVEISRDERGQLGREGFGRSGSEGRSGQIRDARRLLTNGIRDLPHAVSHVRDERSARSIEIPLTLAVPEVAPFPPHDLGEIPGELAVEDVTFRVAMRGSDLAGSWGGRRLTYGFGRPGNRVIGHASGLAARVTHRASLPYSRGFTCVQ
jgi:hypothetical protein